MQSKTAVWLLGIGFCLFAPAALFAQELRIVDSARTTVTAPEAYRAYYGKLSGEGHVYTLEADDEFRLSVVLLAPNVPGAQTDFSATVFDMQSPNEPVIALAGTESEWRWFFDTSGRDEYLAGPVLRGGLPAGTYEVRITNPGNQGTYVLILGEDSWSLDGLISRYTT
ncbi:MAG: hypothetical protein WA021_00495, partial [Minisyncoccia bacterium]